jgi:GT2 family glycosyltransferase
VRVVVVDNGSTDDARRQLRDVAAAAPVPTELVELERNVGFGAAANVGFTRWLGSSSDDWVGLAPHDALLAPGTLRMLVDEAAARPRAGLACADVGEGERPVYDRYFGGMTVAGRSGTGWLPVDYPHGTLMVARRDCLEDVGLFDERYFAYCEETDLGLRARYRGWEVGLVRGAMVHNPTQRSGGPVIDYLMQRNTLLLVRRHSGPYHEAVRAAIALVQLVNGALPGPAPRFGYSARARLWALADAARGRGGPPPLGLSS